MTYYDRGIRKINVWFMVNKLSLNVSKNKLYVIW